MSTIQIEIDGKNIRCEAGRLLLEVARENGFNIPSLCSMDQYDHSGSCRMCVVKIEGQKGVKSSCTTEVEDGMVVTAFSPEIETIRRTILELILCGFARQGRFNVYTHPERICGFSGREVKSGQ